ncbi:DUF5325 family protein [Virgibacillus sp. W0430]|uniref:DUF5325 family protein n=1 Tax=Virgibacillus sp. W0430 TaxID=3391580 RepID=UPI003F4457B5
MGKINVPMLLLAILVILMFVIAGFSIALRNGWLVALFLLLGFVLMGYGLVLKRRK